MKSVFIVSYRWTDIVDSKTYTEMYPNLESAEAGVKKLADDERERKSFDPSSVGKLEITIDRYNFDMQIQQELV